MTKSRVMALLLALLCLPAAAFGTSIKFGNSKGNMSAAGGGTALSLTGSTLVSIAGLPGFNLTGNNIGSVSFTTGTLLTGSLEGSATFGAGGTFSLTSSNGIVFNGTFTSATWTPIPGAGPMNWGWTFAGTMTGTLTTSSGSMTVEAATVQLTTINMGANLNPFRPGGRDNINLSGGSTTVPTSAVPEVGTLGLLGIGLVGAGLFAKIGRGKLIASA
jgi:hypothetical protein